MILLDLICSSFICRVRGYALFVACDALCIINSMVLTSILMLMEISENLSSKVTIKQRICDWLVNPSS